MIAAAVLALVSGCKVDDSEKDNVNVVAEGYHIYMRTAGHVLTPVLRTLDVARKVDMYAKADQEGQYALEDRYFPNYKVRLYDDRCVLSGYEGSSEIVFDGKSITEEGASWNCRVEGVSAVVRCTASGQWNIIVDLSGTVIESPYTIDRITMSAGSVYAEDGSEIMFNGEYVYEVETEGGFTEAVVTESGSVVSRVSFAVTEPTKAVFRTGYSGDAYLYSVDGMTFHFYDGGFNLHLDMTGLIERSEDIDVTLSPAVSGTGITVGYMGESSYWRD